MKEFNKLITKIGNRCLPTISETHFKNALKLFLQYKAKHNCYEPSGMKIGSCNCLKTLLSRENEIDKLVDFVTTFWQTPFVKRNDEFKKTIHGILRDKLNGCSDVLTHPPKIKFKGRLLSLIDYHVCLNAYLASMGIGHAKMRTVKKNTFQILLIKKRDT